MRLSSACLPLVVLALSACSSTESTPPPPAGGVVTYEMTTTIPAGAEAEHCKFIQAPPDGLLINHDVVRYTEGSHHFILYDTNYDAIPGETTDGTPLVWIDEENGVFDCSAGVQFTLDVRQFVAGSQNADGASAVDLPPGVASRVRPNAVLLMNAHYINTSGSELSPQVRIDLHTLSEDELVTEGGVLFFYDIFIRADAMGASRATMRCDVGRDITVTNAQSHMHARGVGFEALVVEPDGARSIFYENAAWENVPVDRYQPGLAVAAGSRIEHSCWYENPESEDVYMGQRSSDEMCVLIASYYPASPELGLCAGDPADPYATFFMGAEWEGQGSATCAESLGCFSDAVNGSGGLFGILRGVTDCVLASDPAVAPELSDAIGCSFSAFRTGGNPLEQCSDAYAACGAK